MVNGAAQPLLAALCDNVLWVCAAAAQDCSRLCSLARRLSRIVRNKAIGID